MKLSKRSYPHPVVGNADDVPGAAFQTTFQFGSDKRYYYITVDAVCSSRKLKRMIKAREACYTLHVECSNTLYRAAFDFFDSSRRFEVEADRLHGPVEINCFVRARKKSTKYRVDGAHDDYGRMRFEIRPGDVLAVAEGQVFEAELHDTMRRIGAIMVVERSGREEDHPMEVVYDEKIRIQLCPSDFRQYQELRAVRQLASHLTTTLVLPVLTEAVHYVIGEGRDEFEGLKWYRILRQRIEGLETREDDCLKIAQALLDMPIRRAFAAAAQYALERE